MRLFVFSLEGDALNWFNNFPKDSFTSLQDIVNAFKDRYGDPNSSLCAPKIVQKKDNNLIKGPAVNERFQDPKTNQQTDMREASCLGKIKEMESPPKQ